MLIFVVEEKHFRFSYHLTASVMARSHATDFIPVEMSKVPPETYFQNIFGIQSKQHTRIKWCVVCVKQ